MATSFDEIIDLGIVTVDDYKLVKLWQQNEDGFKQFCDGFLIRAIPNFFRCNNNLSYNSIDRQFNDTLTSAEISILADLWAIEWFTRETQNSAQFQLKLKNSGSFNFHSEAQNLKEKSVYLDKLREKVSQKITDYQLEDLSNLNL